MTTTLTTRKSTVLSKGDPAVRDLAFRLERARQTRNERIARADADYVDAVRRALAMVEPDAGGAAASVDDTGATH